MNKTQGIKWLVGAAALVCASAVYAAGADPKFIQVCSGCHGADAKGIPGMAPPLDNPELWKKLGDQRQRYIAGIVTGGMSGTIISEGNKYTNLVMPPFSYLDTQELAEITNYVLKDVNGVGAGPDAKLIDQLKASPLSHKALRQIRSTVN